MKKYARNAIVNLKRQMTKQIKNIKPSKKKLESYYCVVCCEDYDEDWIQCGYCKGWAHEAYADIPECSDVYVCDHCNFFIFF